jgi:sulfoxide reductase heme-binding subunit YedZ
LNQAHLPIGPARVGLFAACLLPALWLAWQSWHGQLGSDPVQAAQRLTGTWTLSLLLLTLCISPLRALTQLHWLLRLRRTLGLFTFFYATLHGLCYLGLAHDFAVDAIIRDIFKHPYVGLGLAAFVLLVPLAATSNQWAIRRLGGRRWQDLHRSIYPIAILGCLHLLWQSDAAELPSALGFSLLLAILLWWRIRERRRKAVPMQRSAAVQPIRFHDKRPD